MASTCYWRAAFVCMIFVSTVLPLRGASRHAIVVDSVSRSPLGGASVFDRRGNFIGVSNAKGRMPYIPANSYPILLRFLGFDEKSVPDESADTIFMQENYTDLPEVVVESRQQKVLHLLAYVREYSTLTSFTDTVFLFREKMVDFMLNPDPKSSFKGWRLPRIIKAKSYYRFTDAYGLDSVSDENSYHFSWSDWVGASPTVTMPAALRGVKAGVDTLKGRYGAVEAWGRNVDRVSVSVDVLADIAARKWVPEVTGFIGKEMEFDRFRIRYNYDNVIGDSVSPMHLTGYSFNVESRGRGRKMFKFNNLDQPIYVTTYGEVYIVDKEAITIKEAKKWEKIDYNNEDFDIIEPAEAPPLHPGIGELMARIDGVDKSGIRLSKVPDARLGSGKFYNPNFNFGNRVLLMLKETLGISAIKAHRNRENMWKEFRNERKRKNNRRP